MKKYQLLSIVFALLGVVDIQGSFEAKLHAAIQATSGTLQLNLAWLREAREQKNIDLLSLATVENDLPRMVELQRHGYRIQRDIKKLSLGENQEQLLSVLYAFEANHSLIFKLRDKIGKERFCCSVARELGVAVDSRELQAVVEQVFEPMDRLFEPLKNRK
ncbi:hypothetical protein KBC04_04900 [Candidatus Babeliales bacterium]|nr:hypothetical protein [Candidatus Babeliales bacterium]MBP9844329.1 hypothetical protein [Candidatus Babeliales bacterium]